MGVCTRLRGGVNDHGSNPRSPAARFVVKLRTNVPKFCFAGLTDPSRVHEKARTLWGSA
jgi:hypothetical protein